MSEVTRAELGSWRAKLFYGFGSIAYGVKDFGFGTLLLFYYNQVVGLPAAEVSLAILVVLWVDAFADPLVGQISSMSDRARRTSWLAPVASRISSGTSFRTTPLWTLPSRVVTTTGS